ISEVEQGQIRSGYVIVTPDSSSAGPMTTVTFGIVNGGLVQSQGGMSPGMMATDAALFVESIPGISRNLGIGIVNPGAAINTITLTLRDISGTIVGTPVTVTLQPQQQLAKFVNELLPSDLIGSGFRGSLRIQSSTPFGILGFRFSGQEFSTTP